MGSSGPHSATLTGFLGDDVQIDSEILALIVLLTAQTGAMFYWGGRVGKAVNILEKLVENHGIRIHNLEIKK